MSAGAQSFHSVPYVLGLGYAVEFRFDRGRVDALWSPRVPDDATARALLPRYREARDLALTGAAGALGLNIGVFDGGGEAA